VTDGKALEKIIKDCGITITHIAAKMGCSRNRIYSILDGSECVASEIVGLSEILHLTKSQRDAIFLLKNVN
jgi:plasmid maintenance system antidote protein VapI